MPHLQRNEPKRISSRSTTFWKWIFPALWIPGVGAVAILAWLDLLKDPLSLMRKLGVVGIWAATSALLVGWSRALHHVWLAEDHLIVSGSGGKVRIRLEHIQDITESRFQKMKYIKVSLDRPTAIGRVFRFAPPLALQQPFSDHPAVREIKARRRALMASSEEGS